MHGHPSLDRFVIELVGRGSTLTTTHFRLFALTPKEIALLQKEVEH